MKTHLIRLTLFALLSGLILVCGNCSHGKKKEPLKFNLPTIPMSVTSQEEADQYMARHYWDNFPFNDSLCIHQNNFAVPIFSSFAQNVRAVPHSEGITAMKNFMRLVDSSSLEEQPDNATRRSVLLYFAQLCKQYLDDPNSPYLNEEYYIVVLQKLTESPLLTAEEKTPYQNRLELALRNRVGTKAYDLEYIAVDRNFPYTDDPDHIQKLYEIEAPYILLFFNNPGCPNCKEVTQQIQSSQKISQMIAKKELLVLSLYPDTDLAAWQDYLPNLPGEWINAYNPSAYIKLNNIYDLKAIPTLYLLDKDKIVLLKDGLSALHVEQALK